VGQFADVAQAVLAGGDLDKHAEVLDRRDRPVVDAADLDLLGHGFHAGQGVFGPGSGIAGDNHRPLVVDVDRLPSLFLPPTNVLAPWTDEETDLRRVDLRAQETRRRARNLGARPANRRQHRFQKFDAGIAGLGQRRTDDFLADAVDLEIELNAGDALLSAGHL